MALRNCLLFAVWVPPGKIHRLYDYISLFNTYLHNFDIYVGINHGTDKYVPVILKELKNVVYIGHVKPELTVDSDASAFINIIDHLKRSEASYNHAYFMHTKGMSYGDDPSQNFNYRKNFYQHTVNLVKSIDNISKLFALNSEIGGWCQYGGIHKGDADYEHNISVDPFPWPHTYFEPSHGYSGVLWLFTNYVIRFDILKRFIKKLPQTFFTTNIGYRYYFEFIFPLIIDLMGYIKHVEEWCPYTWRTDVGWHVREFNSRHEFMLHRWRNKMTKFVHNCADHKIHTINSITYCLNCGHHLHNGIWYPFDKEP
jgi:hypothetical protein